MRKRSLGLDKRRSCKRC